MTDIIVISEKDLKLYVKNPGEEAIKRLEKLFYNDYFVNNFDIPFIKYDINSLPSIINVDELNFKSMFNNKIMHENQPKIWLMEQLKRFKVKNLDFLLYMLPTWEKAIKIYNEYLIKLYQLKLYLTDTSDPQHNNNFEIVDLLDENDDDS